MDNKSFKEMIKKHQVKQSFVRLDPDEGKESLIRFYQDTSNPDLLYMHSWCIDPESNRLVKTVDQTDKGNWQYHWHKYVSQCMHADAYKVETYFEKSRTAPMQQRKYWLIKAQTVLFMQKDARVKLETAV